MRIHIVQKGDTLWEISKKYGVDFEQVKQLNSHLSSPDMIMPGMKIKIPGSSKPVKEENIPAVDVKKETVKKPYKDISPKPLPVIKEDDKHKHMVVKPEMPIQQPPQMPQMPMQPIMQMPVMEQELKNYTTINFPEMPHYKEPEKKEPIKKEKPMPKPIPEPAPKIMPKAMPEPVPKMMPISMPQPMPKPKDQPLPPQPMPMQMMVPMCCHIIHPCYPPVDFPVMAHMGEGFFPHGPMPHPQLGGVMHNTGPGPGMEMPISPMQPADKDCGCKGHDNLPHYNPVPLSTFRGGQQDYQPYQQQPVHGQENNMPPTSLYPPQFGDDMMSSYPYPTPPAYPDYSRFANREEEDETENE
ncbi:SafA/ExsA family spore coat assembly protein [Virgibacillus sp. C22-A2]|uniref:SafA/ExsA family spore coat assembly protein n=1 Tax=Virgibacillus tibetensis TaxID=3042313 RepID=A0ABU6K9Y6_9BACI|nr:SafA/ExsA family spore coat assembly protein [Virgibacillus sp. C22-A2]